MNDRILNQRFQDQLGNDDLQKFLVYIDNRPDPVLISELLDSQIIIHTRYFLGNCNKSLFADAGTQQLRESGDHF